MHLLNPGNPFPRLTMNVLGGEVLTVPDAFAGDFATLLFYRGAWCPHCNAQLDAFQRAGQSLADAPAVAAVTGFVLDRRHDLPDAPAVPDACP